MQKGQPGYMIFAPITGRFASSNPADPSSWRRLGPREKHKVNEVVRTRMVGARPAYVWDVTQTEGDPIPETPAPKLLDGEAPAGLWDGLAAQVEVGCGMESGPLDIHVSGCLVGFVPVLLCLVRGTILKRGMQPFLIVTQLDVACNIPDSMPPSRIHGPMNPLHF